VKAKRQAEQLAKEKAKRDAEEAKEKAKREAKEAKRAGRAEMKAKRQAEHLAKEKAKREAKEAKRAKKAGQAKTEAKTEAEEEVGAELYEGMVKLTIASPVDYEQIRKLEEYLRQVQNLHLVSVGGSTEEGTKIVVSAEEPIPLASVLREMPSIEQVVRKGKEIQVTLKARF
jgi:colicin import membrane protein